MTMSKKTIKQQYHQKKTSKEYLFRLYIAGQTPHSVLALNHLKKFCEAELSQKYHIELVDLLQFPHLASADQVWVVPTVVRKHPMPICKVVGDLSTQAQRANLISCRHEISQSQVHAEELELIFNAIQDGQIDALMLKNN